MDLDKYSDYHVEYIEVENLPQECNGCREDCGNCDSAGLRWYLSEKDNLILQRKAKADHVKRLLRDLEKLDVKIAHFGESN